MFLVNSNARNNPNEKKSQRQITDGAITRILIYLSAVAPANKITWICSHANLQTFDFARIAVFTVPTSDCI